MLRLDHVRSAGVRVVTNLRLKLLKFVAGLLDPHLEVPLSDHITLRMPFVELIFEFADGLHVLDAHLEGLELLLREVLHLRGLFHWGLGLELRCGRHGLCIKVVWQSDVVEAI